MENKFSIGQIIKLYEADKDQYIVLNHYETNDTTYLMVYPYDEKENTPADLTKSFIIKFKDNVNDFEYVKDEDELMRILPNLISIDDVEG